MGCLCKLMAQNRYIFLPPNSLDSPAYDTSILNSAESTSILYCNNWGFYDKKRSWNFQKKLGELRKKIGIPEGVVFHTLRNTFVTRMENLGIPRNHICQLMGHEGSNMALTVYSGGLVIECMVESIKKLTYGEEVDSFIEEALTEKSKYVNGEVNDKITDLEILANLQTSESILGSRILRNAKEGD